MVIAPENNGFFDTAFSVRAKDCVDNLLLAFVEEKLRWREVEIAELNEVIFFVDFESLCKESIAGFASRVGDNKFGFDFVAQPATLAI